MQGPVAIILISETSSSSEKQAIGPGLLKDSPYSPENCENRNDPDLVQAFLMKWWVESDFKAPNLQLSLRLRGSGCHYNSIYNKTGTK
jgi:hypothetical protein